ncbi:hypothetical protein [Nocardia gipuzkoensis]
MQQRRLRALLALSLLNTPDVPREVVESDDAHVLRWRNASRLMADRFIFSPRCDDLVVLSRMPGHLAQKVRNFPGIRRHDVDFDHSSLELSHIPTGSSLSFQYSLGRHRHTCDKYVLLGKFDNIPTDRDLTEDEEQTLAALPPITPDAETLLAGLTARLWISSPPEGWAVSALVDDPLRRERYDVDDFVYLWGHGADWVLRWGGWHPVPASDVATALTHPLVGIVGAAAAQSRPDSAKVTLGRATLHLERHCEYKAWMRRRAGIA